MGRALIVGLVISAFYYFLVFDNGLQRRTTIAAAQTNIAELQKQIADSQAKLDRATVYKKTAAEVGSTIHRLLSVIPEHFSTPDLMKIVSNEAKVAGSSLSGITPGDPKVSPVAKEFEELSVGIDLTGSFLQHMTFLSNITKINQILIVRKFDLQSTATASGEDAASVHMTAEIVAFRYRGEVFGAKSSPPSPGVKGP